MNSRLSVFSGNRQDFRAGVFNGAQGSLDQPIPQLWGHMSTQTLSMDRASRSQKRLDIARLSEEMYAKTKAPHSRITARISSKRQSGRRAISNAPSERAVGITANNHVQLADNERTGDAYEPLLNHYPSRDLHSRGVRERIYPTGATRRRA